MLPLIYSFLFVLVIYPFLSNVVEINNVIQKVRSWESVRLLFSIICVMWSFAYTKVISDQATQILMLYPINTLSFAQIHMRSSNFWGEKRKNSTH